MDERPPAYQLKHCTASSPAASMREGKDYRYIVIYRIIPFAAARRKLIKENLSEAS
jgi:hypothetical protein